MAKTTKSFSITLEVDGKQKKITQKGVKVKVMRNIMKYYRDMEQINQDIIDGKQVDQLEILDSMIVLLTEIFDNPAVTFEAIENSIESDDLVDVLENILGTIMGVDDSKEA